jgi:hypothetical protein
MTRHKRCTARSAALAYNAYVARGSVDVSADLHSVFNLQPRSRPLRRL